MFVTIVEAVVEADREVDLRSAWEEKTALTLPAGLIESSLLRSKDEIWRIVTVWESQEAVMAMRASGEPPAALTMFERARPSRPSRCGRLKAERARTTETYCAGTFF